MASNRNSVTFDQLADKWLDDIFEAVEGRVCAYCSELIPIGEDRYIVDDDHVHTDCFRNYAVDTLDAIESDGEIL